MIPNVKIPLVMTPDGNLAVDAVALAQAPVEGIDLKDYPNHTIKVRTLNTLYTFLTGNGKIRGQASKDDGSLPNYLPWESEVQIHGSTWGGSMMKQNFVGKDMCLVFSEAANPCPTRWVRTSRIQTIETFDNSPLGGAISKCDTVLASADAGQSSPCCLSA